MTTTAVKERPILFSGEMVRAILDGRKTQTRRVVKPQPVPAEKAEPGEVVWFGGELQRVRESRGRNKRAAGHLNAHDWRPYGQPGDRLWVKETFRFTSEWDDLPPGDVPAGQDVWFEADGKHPMGWGDGRLRSSIHMPRWASRITLEIVGVRVERLKDISAKDCLAEGIDLPPIPVPAGTSVADAIKWAESRPQAVKAREWAGGFDAGHCQLVRVHYSELWDRINGAGSWDANPWVWALTFRKVDPHA